jgi:futalosine hydrolase
MTNMHQRLVPDIESMEGAAFHYVCLQEEIPFIQLRGISNLVGDRNKNRWQIPTAMETVRFALFKLISKIHETGHP